tara:strand:+ start:1452 stop:2096 length:645 start_codon:yes stop_codon:yes gene_type:complete
MKDAYYFSHDSNARNDQKTMKLRMCHGMMGYGVYWAIIEMLREQEGYCLSINDVDSIAFELRQEEATILSIIKDFGLFEFNDEQFYSVSLSKRMLKMDQIREKRSMAGKAKKSKQELNKRKTSVKQVLNKTEQVKEKKGKEIKVKNNYGEFVRLTVDEYQKLCNAYTKKRTDAAIIKLDNYKGSSGKTYKSDYRALLSWAIDQTQTTKTKSPII